MLLERIEGGRLADQCEEMKKSCLSGSVRGELGVLSYLYLIYPALFMTDDPKLLP